MRSVSSPGQSQGCLRDRLSVARGRLPWLKFRGFPPVISVITGRLLKKTPVLQMGNLKLNSGRGERSRRKGRWFKIWPISAVVSLAPWQSLCTVTLQGFYSREPHSRYAPCVGHSSRSLTRVLAPKWSCCIFFFFFCLIPKQVLSPYQKSVEIMENYKEEITNPRVLGIGWMINLISLYRNIGTSTQCSYRDIAFKGVYCKLYSVIATLSLICCEHFNMLMTNFVNTLVTTC